jgi:2-polyprenyl-3-methyl-5-hydroxy-6-metoxy-1,4-benzoquinol methylase
MPRITALTPQIDLATRRGRFRFTSRMRRPLGWTLAVDLYSHLRESHPETHLGYWVFTLPAGEATHTIGLDFTAIGPGSVWRETSSGGREPAADCWSNPDYRFDPVVGIQLVLRDPKGRVRENRFVTATVGDPEVLRRYYGRVHAGHGYTPSEPFLFELHAAMLRKLDAIFTKRIPQGSRVLDAGCGRSLFTEIRARWPFMIAAADVDFDLLHDRRASFPDVHWAVAPASPLAFVDRAFDAVFAGELIEHLPEPREALAEFRRVLRPQGLLVLTTPNRRRLANVADGSERPYSPDHLSELSFDEVERLLGEAGFEVLESTGVHLELLLNWHSPLPKLDYLQRRWNRPWAVPLMRLLLRAGALAPRLALDLIFVARLRPDAHAHA